MLYSIKFVYFMAKILHLIFLLLNFEFLCFCFVCFMSRPLIKLALTLECQTILNFVGDISREKNFKLATRSQTCGLFFQKDIFYQKKLFDKKNEVRVLLFVRTIL